MERLTDFGIQVPERLPKVAEDVTWLHHTTATALAAIWPVNFWRSPIMGPADFQWFEASYPGWYDLYGRFWETTPRWQNRTAGRS
jgi:methane monooxygenase component A alpha chain/propane monooxygenase large subunit